ncbi:MAG: hypothetical protein V4647_13255 [Pseudomonadota bacterium]
MRKLGSIAFLLLAACGDSGAAPGPGGVSVDEAEALDQAAEMLDSQRLPPELLEEGEGEPAAPAPSATPS